MVEGRLQTRSWDDASTGKKMYRTEVVADRVQFGTRSQGVGNMTPSEEKPVSSSSSGSSEEEPSMDTIEYPEEDINPEDIPF
jgi:single-strand DNA-binding protein